MHITSQKAYQNTDKPKFCYFCGEELDNGERTNSDHCPPEKIFHVSDRINYPIKVKVHEKCNHQWHLEDDKLSVFFDILHGSEKASKTEHIKKLIFTDIDTSQGLYQGLINFPLAPLVHRVIKCVHALLYGEYLPSNTWNHIHYPWPELDHKTGEPHMHSLVTYEFANQLCTAQKIGSYSSIRAYNNKFKYVCTWSKLDNGDDICIFAFDIYKLSTFAVKIKDFPEAVIGAYSIKRPKNAIKCSKLHVENTENEILYPIL